MTKTCWQINNTETHLSKNNRPWPYDTLLSWHSVIVTSMSDIIIYHSNTRKTRKLSYRKDDHMMHQYMGALKIFESLSMPTATFAQIFNGLLLRSILWMCVQNLKFVALPIPEITATAVCVGVANAQSWGRGDCRGSGMVPLEGALVSS